MRGRYLVLIAFGALLLLVIVVAGCGVGAYNTLVNKETQIDNDWAQVQVQYQRRFDLIPNLVESVKGIMEQEREIFGALAEARTRYAGAVQSGTTEEQVGAASQLEGALARLLVIVENYPELRSQQNVTQLMDELSGTENRIAVARARFNESTTDYNRTVRRFPSNLFAGMFGYDQRPLFQAPDDAATAPSVSF